MSAFSSVHVRWMYSTGRTWKILTQMILMGLILFLPSGWVRAQPTPPPKDQSLDQARYSESPSLLPQYTGCGGQSPGLVNAAFEQEVVELVNAERTSRGLPPLKRTALLDQAARYHAADMEQDDYFFHDSHDRQGANLVFVCAWSTRVSNYYPGWNSLGENIAWGYTTPQWVMDGWMDSQGHRDNILSTSFREIGVGFFTGNVWVQDFGRRANVYPLVIDHEAAETESRDVYLYIYGNSSTWTDMRLRNNDLPWSVWMPFQNNVSWQLPNATGTHTVSVELRKGSTTATSSDSIHLTLAPTPELGNMPDSISFSYSIASQQFTPPSAAVTPLNVGDDRTLTWEASQAGDWFQISPFNGETPQTLTITPDGNFTTSGVYADSLTVTVTDPSGTLASPWVITVNLTVVEESQRIYLPTLLKENP